MSLSQEDPATTPAPPFVNKKEMGRRFQVVLLGILVVGSLALMQLFLTTTTETKRGFFQEGNVTLRKHAVVHDLGGNGNKNKKKGSKVTIDSCICRRRSLQQESFSTPLSGGGGNLLNRQDILQLAQSARAQMMETIRQDYGEYFEAIFLGPNTTFSPTSALSTQRLQRKLMIKVLEMQATILEEGCHCQEQGNNNGGNSTTSSTTTTFAKYVWATGGHSAGAGHGNLFDESYTAILGKDARNVFEAIGIAFEDRNYAMGGTSSALEISMCFDQIFGTDVDFFSWDYGMTDGRGTEQLFHYGYRGGRSRGRPALMGMKNGGGGKIRSLREEVLQNLEDFGMATFHGSEESYLARNAAVPDSAAGLSQVQIDALPPMVQNLKCGDKLEKGEPFCAKEKYSKHICAKRGKQAPWHPGFKLHAMDGHAVALFLTGALVEALESLAQHPTADPLQFLAELRQEEDADYDHMLKIDFPEESKVYGPDKKNGVEPPPPDPSLDLDALWKKPSFCRTGRTPAQSRYLGYTTNSDRMGGPAIVEQETYDVGVALETAKATPSEDGNLVLVYEDADRESCKETIVKPDYKDYFFAKKGKSSLSFPNEKERAAYEYDPSTVQGIIFLSFFACSWGKCAEGELRPEDFATNRTSIEWSVNGQPVTELVDFGMGVWTLKGEEGFYWKPNINGNFDLGVSITDDTGFIRLSTVIIY